MVGSPPEPTLGLSDREELEWEPRTGEAEAGGSLDQSQPGLHSENLPQNKLVEKQLRSSKFL